MLRTLAVPVVAMMLAASCGGGDKGSEPSQDAIDDFCAAGLDLVRATIEDPGGNDAEDAFDALDPDVAEALDVRLNRLDPADNDDPLDMADRFTDVGCDDDDFDDLIRDISDDEGAATTVLPTTPGDTVVETTVPDTGVPPASTAPGSTLPGSDLLIGVIVPAGPPPADAIAEVEANSSAILGDIETEMQTLGMTVLGLPMYYPEGGYLFNISADNSFGTPDDKVGVLMAADDPKAVLEAMASFIESTDSFDRSDSSRTDDGDQEFDVRLSQSDFEGPDYSIIVSTKADRPGVVRVVVERTVFGTDDAVEVPVPQVVLDAFADEIPAAEANGQTDIDSWGVELGMSTFGDFPTKSFSINWEEQTGDKSAVGTAICAARGYEVSSDDEFGVSCSSPDFTVTWTTSAGFDDGTFTVRIFGSFS